MLSAVKKQEKKKTSDKKSTTRKTKHEIKVNQMRIYQCIVLTLSLSLEKSVYRLKTTQLSSGLLFTSILYTCVEKQEHQKNMQNFKMHWL